MANFMNLMLTLWTISNSSKYDANLLLENVVSANAYKLAFFLKFADLLEEWANCPNYCLINQTENSIFWTLRSDAMFIRDLLGEGFEYVMTRKL